MSRVRSRVKKKEVVAAKGIKSRLPDPVTVTLQPPCQRGQVTFHKEALVTEDDHLLHTLARAVEQGVQGHKVCCVRSTVYGWFLTIAPHRGRWGYKSKAICRKSA